MPANKLNPPYTEAEVKRIALYAAKGWSARYTAQQLGRPYGGLRYKAMREGITFTSINQARGVQKRPALCRKLSKLAKARAR